MNVKLKLPEKFKSFWIIPSTVRFAKRRGEFVVYPNIFPDKFFTLQEIDEIKQKLEEINDRS